MLFFHFTNDKMGLKKQNYMSKATEPAIKEAVWSMCDFFLFLWDLSLRLTHLIIAPLSAERQPYPRANTLQKIPLPQRVPLDVDAKISPFKPHLCPVLDWEKWEGHLKWYISSALSQRKIISRHFHHGLVQLSHSPPTKQKWPVTVLSLRAWHRVGAPKIYICW